MNVVGGKVLKVCLACVASYWFDFGKVHKVLFFGEKN
jgi:hypothetical protein